MKYTVRFAHLEHVPELDIGDVLRRGDIVGIMGSTGQSTGAHLHIDCVVGDVRKTFKLADIGTRYAPAQKQLNYFIDSELFKCKPVITTHFMDSTYRKQFRKDHPAIDVVPFDATKKLIYWNRSFIGTVTNVVYQPESYGHCLYVMFDTDKKA